MAENSTNSGRPATRRRGQALLQAIHAATLAELAEVGYARLTMEAVAARAGTGKAALYRRWSAKRDLVLDALNAALPDLTQPLDSAPDLRSALLACLRGMSDVLAGRTAFPGVAALVEMMREPELGEAFRDRLIAGRLGLVRSVLERAVEQGEIGRDAVTPLVVRTGPALVLQGFLMTGTPPPEAELEQIVDEVLLPLLKPNNSKDILNVMSAELPHHRHRDPKALRAIAHPVRMQLLELVAIAGQATATELAEQVGESPANTSWHLRQLAKYGFIEPASTGTGRERPWRYVPRSYSAGGSDENPELAAASDAESLLLSAEREFEQLRTWVLRHRAEPAEWQDAGFTLQSVTWLRPEELRELNEQLKPLFTAHLDRVLDPAKRPADGRLTRLFAWGVPAPR